jgi:hypothetical protein
VRSRIPAPGSLEARHKSIMHLINMTITGTKCEVKDALVNQLVALNNKLNTLSPALVRSEQGRAEIQQQRERLHVEIQHHKTKGHDGKPCPAIQHEW